MNKKYLFATAAIVLTAFTLAFLFADNSTAGNVTKQRASTLPAQLVSSAADEDFKWYTVNEALQVNKLNGKKVFIDVYTTWCGPCKMLDANTFSNPTIRKILNEYYIPTKFNAEGADTILFDGKTFTNPKYSPQPRKSTHQFALYVASTDNGLGYPTMVFLNENLQLLQPIAGYLQPSQLEPILMFYGTDAYKTTDWPTFLASFKSEITQ